MDEQLQPENDVKLIVDLKAAFDSYANAAAEFKLYDDKFKIIYPALGLVGEAGEVADKIKKAIRDNNGNLDDDARLAVAKELGDVLWYIAALARDINVPFHIIPLLNINKLQDRKNRGVQGGSGDNR
jgi:NTP pyrophosphatase (non-canonical NTP hydrolase)